MVTVIQYSASSEILIIKCKFFFLFDPWTSFFFHSLSVITVEHLTDNLNSNNFNAMLILI